MSLEGRLAAAIRADGPLRLDRFMAEVLWDPRGGYYATRDPLGAAGDFITAPEVSQIFGEVIGLALAQVWLDMDRPAARLVELGPGRGTLMADALRAARNVPGFEDAVSVHLIERSAPLRALQARAVSGAAFHDALEEVPEGPLLLVANEFFDALPVRQLVRAGGLWREKVVGLRDGTLAFGLAAPAPVPELDRRLDDTAEGDLVEWRPAADPVMAEIGRRLRRHGGTALVVDYGDWRSQGDTLQALRAHAPADPLDAPGTADLTAHVDFEALHRAAHAPSASLLTTQGVLLERLGATDRARALAASAPARADALAAAHRRLTHPEEMGTLFKAMAWWGGVDAVPGLARMEERGA
ncbi:SAM-dependent MidA family methyltransferase [Hasllibacter halocynthiae]|uniref:SAM-dependent MidA family methyltransferase n=1 Tax=Hasllibacter halocynthiae TaxID=595589 RepID=A0A2T0X0V4_9RHOB|nr:SAM-dependent methyltransferase [Hasllibacter halocynthiae]PRY92582.1 SAM-dependent MidA family methyltransferase [Hasllibacter halocynthiae]